MTPLALTFLAVASYAGQPATPPPAGDATPNSLPTGPGTDVTPIPPAPSSEPSSGPLGGALPVTDAPFGYLGPHPFAPNPFLGEGYSRPNYVPPPRGRLQSDHEFDGFIRPLSNPVLAMDPRSSTYARLVFVNNNFPGENAFGGGNAQFYIPQVGVALTERFELMLNKMGGVHFDPFAGGNRSGGLNLSVGGKYTFYRCVEDQCIAAAGLLYETGTGSSRTFQGKNGGLITPFVTYGKEFCDDWHLLGTHGVQLPGNPNQNSTFFYHSLHLDRRFFDCFVPFAELNYFQYVREGGLVPTEFGEGDGLLNFGTTGQGWKQTLNMAGGAAVILHECVQIGAAYVFPVSGRKDILNNRIVVELQVRY